MKNFKIRIMCTILTVALGITTMVGCGSAEVNGDRTVLTVDGTEISLGTASLALRYAQAQTDMYYKQMAALYEGLGASGQDWEATPEGESQTSGELMKADIISRLEKMAVVKEHAAEYGVELGQSEKDRIAEAAKEFIESNDASVLRKMGVTQENVEEYLELETYYRDAYEPMIKDKDTSVTDEEAKQSTVTYTFLSKNKLGEEEAKAAMEELLEEYKKEDDIANFDMEAPTEGKDDGYMTSTASFGDDDEEGTGFDQAAKDAARTLKDGELYQEVITGAGGGGFFIVRMDKVVDPEATEGKKESLEREKGREVFDEMVDKWVEEATVSVDEKVWQDVKLLNKEAYVVKVPETIPEPAAEEELAPAEEQ